jgi:hypothetical protein
MTTNPYFLPDSGKSRLWGIIFFVFQFGKPKKVAGKRQSQR